MRIITGRTQHAESIFYRQLFMTQSESTIFKGMGGWFWYDETWCSKIGPYPSEKAAKYAQRIYDALILKGKRSYLICA